MEDKYTNDYCNKQIDLLKSIKEAGISKEWKREVSALEAIKYRNDTISKLKLENKQYFMRILAYRNDTEEYLTRYCAYDNVGDRWIYNPSEERVYFERAEIECPEGNGYHALTIAQATDIIDREDMPNDWKWIEL